jgi:hypothetical protein
MNTFTSYIYNCIYYVSVCIYSYIEHLLHHEPLQHLLYLLCLQCVNYDFGAMRFQYV